MAPAFPRSSQARDRLLGPTGQGFAPPCQSLISPEKYRAYASLRHGQIFVSFVQGTDRQRDVRGISKRQKAKQKSHSDQLERARCLPRDITSAQAPLPHKIAGEGHKRCSRTARQSMAGFAQTLAERANICGAAPPTSGSSINREVPIGRCPISLGQRLGITPHGEAGMTHPDHMTCPVRRTAAPSPRRNERRGSGRLPASPPVIFQTPFGSGTRRPDDRLLAIATTLIVWLVLATLVEACHLGPTVRHHISPSHFRTLPSVQLPNVANSSAPAFTRPTTLSGALFSQTTRP